MDERLKSLEKAITDFRARLKLHGLFDADHQVTDKELSARWVALQREVDSHAASEDSTRRQMDFLERDIVKWINSTDLDFKI